VDGTYHFEGRINMKLTRNQFDELVLQHLDMLYRVALKLSGDPHDAEDLVQETCLRACGAAERFELHAYGMRPWLVRIMHNLHSNAAIRESRQPAAVDDERLDAEPGSPLRPSWERRADFEGMDDRLVHALNQLSEPHRCVVLLWAVEDFSLNEIASALRIPVGTVMSRLHRARKQLSASLADLASDRGMLRRCA
jgi:RNA polymerase sigma-70 factor (ECF subfamily)